MNGRIALIAAAAVALLVGGLTWLWYDQMEQHWEAVEKQSRAASENPMLAATMLLRQAGHGVTVAGTMGEIDMARLPDGTLVIADSSGITHPAAAEALLAWVRRGNTLVTEPRWANAAEKKRIPQSPAEAKAEADEEAAADEEDEEEEGSEDADGEEPAQEPAQKPEASAAPAKAAVGNELFSEPVETDPLAARLGVRQVYKARPRKCPEAAAAAPASPAPARSGKAAATNCIPAADYKPELRSLMLPGAAYALTLDETYTSLRSMPGALAPLWSDTSADALRVYGEGRGHIVMLAANYFTNHELRQYDHGQLLLALAALNPKARAVTIVQMLDVLPWYAALWLHWRYLLIALGVCLALAFWMAVRRFGPMLPQPDTERRSLMEHIAASGAWLWKAEGGSTVLLDAAREETLALVRRRAPGLMRLPTQELAAALARDTGLDSEHLAQALYDDASRQVARFTRQIRTLQELRNHYER